MNKQQLLLEHPQKEKITFDFFNKVIEEIKVVFLAPEAVKFVGIRLQMIAAFTLAEVLSNYWDCYINQQRKPDARITDWFNTFCAINSNKTYNANSDFKRLGADPLLQLRHSLIHFFGLSPQKIGKQIALGSSDMDNTTFQKYASGFGKDVAVFKPIDFYNLFKDGGLLMLNQILGNIQESGKDETKKWIHIEGIDRIYQKFQTEGAMHVIIPKKN